MRQAQTLNEAQLRRVLHYCRSRRHPVRDQTIVLFSFYAGLRAKEIAALTVGDVFDDAGAVREQFILAAAQSTQLLWLPPVVQEIFDRFSACDRLRASFRPILQRHSQKPRPVW